MRVSGRCFSGGAPLLGDPAVARRVLCYARSVAEPLGAGQEIEQTLRLARQATELRIARYRVWFFSVLLIVSTWATVALGGLHRGLVPFVGPLLFAPVLVYALLFQRYLNRRAAARRSIEPWLVYTSIVIDVLAIVLHFVLEPRDGMGHLVLTHVVAPCLMLLNVVNLLRNDVRASLVCAAASAAVVVPLYLLAEPFNPVIAMFPAGLALIGLLGVAAARQTRRSLDVFARLQLLKRYLPPQAVERVLTDDADDALSLGGRLVNVTLLAADLRGFTSLSEKLAPDEVVRQLNAYHGAMLHEVNLHGGVLDKFIGDGTLVIFGLPEGAGDGPADCGATAAVACARDMLRALERHNEERARQGQAPLRMGIGVHTGAVVAGNIGAPGQRLEFTVIGDAVNTASRLEGLTKEAGTPLLISAETAARLPAAEGLHELTPMRAKGKETILRVFGIAGQAA